MPHLGSDGGLNVGYDEGELLRHWVQLEGRLERCEGVLMPRETLERGPLARVSTRPSWADRDAVVGIFQRP